MKKKTSKKKKLLNAQQSGKLLLELKGNNYNKGLRGNRGSEREKKKRQKKKKTAPMASHSQLRYENPTPRTCHPAREREASKKHIQQGKKA